MLRCLPGFFAANMMATLLWRVKAASSRFTDATRTPFQFTSTGTVARVPAHSRSEPFDPVITIVAVNSFSITAERYPGRFPAANPASNFAKKIILRVDFIGGRSRTRTYHPLIKSQLRIQ
jgi:hypothetical protein